MLSSPFLKPTQKAVAHGFSPLPWRRDPPATTYNFIEVPTEIVFQVLLFWVRYKVSYWDIAKMFLLRAVASSQELVRDWEERFAPFLFRS